VRDETAVTAARALIPASKIIGGGSLLLFGVFLLRGPWYLVELTRTVPAALTFDAALSMAFFLQHSVMVRSSFRDRLARIVPPHLHGAVYSIASGLVLALVVVLWQPTDEMVLSVGQPARLFLRVLFIASVLGFAWAVSALGSFDGFGVKPVKAHLEGRPIREMPLTIRGPYRWVRHPLYTLVLIMIWTQPDLTADRLLFNLTWTGWIILGSVYEERDLIREFGDDYRRYRRIVPMLIPWRRPLETDALKSA
jgi:protein-S-isoprenylcysteine O-methyltransferase Ste14